MGLLGAYNRMLAKHPVKAASAATGFLMLVGDVVAQTYLEQRALIPQKEVEIELPKIEETVPEREGPGYCYPVGQFVNQPVLHYVEPVPEPPQPAEQPEQPEPVPIVPFDPFRTAKFAMIGAALFGPSWTFWYRYLDKIVPKMVRVEKLQGLAKVAVDQIFFAPALLLFFLYILDLPKEIDPIEYWKIKQEDFQNIMVNYYKIWPGVQLFNFYVVPVQHRVMVINFVALFWNTFLAWKANADPEPPSTEVEE